MVVALLENTTYFPGICPYQSDMPEDRKVANQKCNTVTFEQFNFYLRNYKFEKYKADVQLQDAWMKLLKDYTKERDHGLSIQITYTYLFSTNSNILVSGSVTVLNENAI